MLFYDAKKDQEIYQQYNQLIMQGCSEAPNIQEEHIQGMSLKC